MKKLKLAMAGAAIAVLGTASLASAGVDNDPESVTYVYGNPKCASGFAYQLKLDPPSNGTFGAIVISNYDGKTFDWAIHPDFLNVYDANTVIVKGGPNALVYMYADPADDMDSGLHAPVNPNNGKYYGISHIQFCFDPKG
jgi:hypothetical protein